MTPWFGVERCGWPCAGDVETPFFVEKLLSGMWRRLPEETWWPRARLSIE